ncbi:MAG: YicC family protein [Balneola sp.]|nr:YicC family protein [Balneola sp.]MBE80597.1 YicC family protein [Balneola sp.]MBE80649.1 YicC family protein [Balneola sp.]HBX67638.1 YicC family protein [Balneolaceae bacterium]|tara:strand:+ start:3689 stop:4558 length:870 start_codon:yes stop_codon:yes gene_type:complete
MTGFGRGEASENGITSTVEIKSLNSRYLDLSIRLPQRLQDKELEVKELVQKTVNRGKLNITVYISESETGEPAMRIDEKKVKGYSKILNNLREAAGISDPITIKDITQFNDVFINEEEDEETIEQKWNVAEKALQQAVESLLKMRTQEGSQLKNDLVDRIEFIEDNLEIITKETAGRAEDARDKLLERINNLIEEDKIDPERLELEVAVLVDKMDVTEEIVRLRSHLKFFIEAVDQPEPAGRRLNFLTQEINRELNTIGSKANNSEIAQYVVKCKEALEQIREQVQNVE